MGFCSINIRDGLELKLAWSRKNSTYFENSFPIFLLLYGEKLSRGKKDAKFLGFTFANGSPEFISRDINFRVYRNSCNSRGINFCDSRKKSIYFLKKKKKKKKKKGERKKERKKENEKSNNIFILKSKLFLLGVMQFLFWWKRWVKIIEKDQLVVDLIFPLLWHL